MDQPLKDAVVILATAEVQCAHDYSVDGAVTYMARLHLIHAIRHITRPDRDIYPKVRESRKTDRRISAA